jgi:hypothetical protein
MSPSMPTPSHQHHPQAPHRQGKHDALHHAKPGSMVRACRPNLRGQAHLRSSNSSMQACNSTQQGRGQQGKCQQAAGPPT